MVRRNGQMPADAQPVAANIDADLADYGFAILDAALELRAQNRTHQQAIDAFRMAGRVFEALVKNGDSERDTRGFYRVIAAASHHLAGYSAVAYVLFSAIDEDDLNLNPGEKCLVRLTLRDLDGVRNLAHEWQKNPAHQDVAISQLLSQGNEDREDALIIAILGGLFRGIASFEFALQTGEPALADQALSLLEATRDLAGETGHISLWWVARLTRDLVSDLWSQSLHEVIPFAPATGEEELYTSNRALFIASLFAQSASQVELWPSQIIAARRAADPADDLVVALPTSAGKTRIAELAALTCLSLGKRVVLITPLRALSAQTETSFRSTFVPLGATVSSLYGKSGISAGDANALNTDQIVVATPEKLDFALRSDPNIIDDVGLIVLDEGHLIGDGEREVRYEILVQRLLRRRDSDQRRIVCLSAILPEGDELDDMTAWIRSDVEGDAVRSEWRPTNQRFGTLEWNDDRATLRYDLDDNGPFVSRFLNEMEPIKPERTSHPRDLQEVSLMGAWQFAQEGKRSLIYVTQANWVEGFAKRALSFVKKGYFPNLLVDENAIKDALVIGNEWLGEDHPAVACLRIGMAVHHGGLPSPFLREVERLLTTGVIDVIAASPTLAQGLNLNAAVLLAPYLVREGSPISGEEFANVAGRAGRAYVDTEGLILHVMMDRHTSRKREWRNLIQGVKARSLKSGLLLVIDQVVKRLMKRGIENNEVGYEFLANSREDWLIEPEDTEGIPLEDLVERLDSIVFGLIEALDADVENLPDLLDDALSGSLWLRQMAHLEDGVKSMQLIVLKARARLIWNHTTPIQRKGHFAMGVGLDTGLHFDDLADVLAEELDRADLAALRGNLDEMHSALVSLAGQLLTVKPFIPSSANLLMPRWEEVLHQWLAGEPFSTIGNDHNKLIEEVFVYRLVWAIEAVRTRRVAHGWDGGDIAVSGMAAACLDTGLPDYRMSMLVRAGLPSRSAAMQVVTNLDPAFLDVTELRAWLNSDEVNALSQRADWPTVDTKSLWNRFREGMIQGRDISWSYQHHDISVITKEPITGNVFRVENQDPAEARVLTGDFRDIGTIKEKISLPDQGLAYGQLLDDGRAVLVTIGPR
jgi:hypothetical protein